MLLSELQEKLQEKQLQEDKQQRKLLSKHGLNPEEEMDIAYYSSSFDYKGQESPEAKEDDFGTEIDDENDIHDLVFLPAHTQVSDDTKVRITKQGQIIQEDEWENIINWLRSNFKTLDGKYYIEDQKGNVLHSFKITT